MHNVYLDYDAPSLAAEYNNRGKVPEYENIAADWLKRSQEFTEKHTNSRIDLKYGDGDRMAFDLFLPDREKPPLHIFIHGGYWQWNEKEPYAFLAQPFVEAGIAFATLEYSLCPNVTFETIVEQIRTAILHIAARSEELGFDGSRVLLSGHSAGGHLTATVLTTDWQALSPNSNSPVTACMPISGIYDLEPIRHTPIGDALELDDLRARSMSPMFSPPRIDVPTAITLGALEGREFHRQAEEFAANIRRHGARVEILSVADCNHFTILEELATGDGKLFAKSLELLAV